MQQYVCRISLFCTLALIVILLEYQQAFSQDGVNLPQLQSKEPEKRLAESIVRVEGEEKTSTRISAQFPLGRQTLANYTNQQTNQPSRLHSSYQPFTAVADGLSRYAIKFATGSTRKMFVSGIYPAIFRQEPRYQPSGKHGVKSRLLYAASRVFVTKSDQGDLQPNISRLGGSLTASAFANIWERNSIDRDRIGVGATFQRFGTMVGLDVIRFIVLEEFGPDIKRKLFKK